LTAEYFSNRFYDLIGFEFCFPDPAFAAGNSCNVVVPGAPPFFGYFINVDRARARGVDFSVDSLLRRWLRLRGNYTLDDSRVVSSPNALDPALVPGNHLIRRPVNSGSIVLLAAWRRISGSFAGYFSGQRTDTDFLGLGLARTPGYGRFDISTAYDFGRGIGSYVRVQNLFDKQYQDALGYPAPGREVRVGMNYRFSGKR